MTASTTNGQVENKVSEQKNDRETNFRLQEKALQDKYERQLQQERAARLEAERRIQELSKVQHQNENQDDDHDDEPYVDKKRLNKTLAKFGQATKQETQTEIQKAVHTAIQEERKQAWLKTNSDFYDVLQNAEKFAQHDPELAETILQMPEGFERQKLVYKNIKALGLHKEPVKQASIQEKIDSNKRNQYYQPSGMGSAPYAGGQGDYSPSGQKDAYAKMIELKNRLRI